MDLDCNNITTSYQIPCELLLTRREKKAEIARRMRMERSVRSTPYLCDFADGENYDDNGTPKFF